MQRYERIYNLSGGMKDVTEEEKLESISQIKEAIEKNNKGIKTRVSYEIFAKGYPEAINLVKDYCDALYQCRYNETVGWKHVGWKENIYSNKQSARSKALKTVSPLKYDISVIFLPLYLENKISRLDFCNILGLTSEQLVRVLNRYKGYAEGKETNILSIVENDSKVDIAIDTVEIFVEENITKKEFESKYKVNLGKSLEIVEQYDVELYNQAKKILEQNAREYYHHLQNLVPTIGEYISFGIDLNGKKIPFTILDYYSLTNIDLLELANKFKGEFKDKYDFYNIQAIGKFIERNRIYLKSKPIPKENKLKNKISYVIDGETKIIDKAMVDLVYEELSKNNIPLLDININVALRRLAHNEPIFPLLESEKIK